MVNKNDFIYLVKCGIDGIAPEKFCVDEAGQLALLKKAQELFLGAVVASSIEKSSCATPQILNMCRQIKMSAFRREMIFESCRKEILSEFERVGIWYAPLKGCVLKDFYPEYAMREMADNDILFDKTYRRKVKGIMLSLGYSVVDYGDYIHDVYINDNSASFEMHTALFNSETGDNVFEYYRDIDKKLLSDGNKRYFKDEDMYVYIVAHTYKHMVNGATGLRSLTDLYLFLKEKQNKMDWLYIDRQFELLNLKEFENKIRNMSQKIFSDNSNFSEDEKLYIDNFLDYGAYGTIHSKVNRYYENQNGEKTKIQILLYRLFKNKKWWYSVAPITEKYHFLIIYYRLKRIVRGLLTKPCAIIEELKVILRF